MKPKTITWLFDMPRFRQTTEILRLMNKKDSIRNVGIIAHIDHGKTTLTDSLLVEAGLLPEEVAGTAKVLDYLDEEQKRGITIKTANISFVHEAEGSRYLINLVDTPGHVDFTGKVARALRAIDGVVVVIDAVEEVMAQTETVTVQALQERVRPILFINKVDRLIKELRLSPSEIQKKFTRIITDFNSIIDVYSEPEFKDEWKVDLEKQSVVFGSALHKWGFTLKIAERKSIKFSDRDIRNAYANSTYHSLSKIIPLHTAILDAIVKNIPSPLASQRYRVPKIWKGRLDSEAGEAMLSCSDRGPTVMCITAVQAVQNEGSVATGRVFSGSVKRGDHVYLIGAERDGVVGKVSLCMSSFRESAEQVNAGNIAAVDGLESAKAGETLVDIQHKHAAVPFEQIGYISEPVMTVAVEPCNPKDLEHLIDALRRLSTEDPNLQTIADKETGQYLISGTGELHLEVALNQLRHNMLDIQLNVSSPDAAHREGIRTSGALAKARSPNKLNELWVQVEPLESETASFLEEIRSNLGSALQSKIIAKDGEEEIWASDEDVNILVNVAVKIHHIEDMKNSIISGFQWACRTGPLCEQRLRGVKVKLTQAHLDTNAETRDYAQVMRTMSRAILGSVLTAKPIILEPIYKIEVTTSAQWLGKCSNLITRRRGKVASIQQNGPLAVVVGYMPVAESFSLASEIRSATSGHAFWQLSFDHWEKVPESLAPKIIRRLREKKGLNPEVPKPEVFADEVYH